MEKRSIKVFFNKSGAGNYTPKITLPKKWIDIMGLNQENRDVEISFDEERKEIKIMKTKKYIRKPYHEGIKGESAKEVVMTQKEAIDYILGLNDSIERNSEYINFNDDDKIIISNEEELILSGFHGDVTFYEFEENNN